MFLSCLYTTFPVFWGALELKKYKRTAIIENWDKPELLQHRASWITTINDTDTKFSIGLLMLFRPYGSYFFLCLACLLQWRRPREHCRNSLAVKEKKTWEKEGRISQLFRGNLGNSVFHPIGIRSQWPEKRSFRLIGGCRGGQRPPHFQAGIPDQGQQGKYDT